MKNGILLLIGLLTSFLSYSQGYDIKVKINGLNCDDELILANHFGDKQYSRDTSECANGVFHFTGDTRLESGIYLIVLPSRNYFEVVMSVDEDQTQYYFEADTTLNQTIMKTSGSANNKVFFEFNAFITTKAAEINTIKEAMDIAPDDATKTKLRESITEITKEMRVQRKALGDDNTDLFIGKVYKAMQDIKVPDAPEGMTDSAKRVFGYIYYRSHFWDNVDLGEDGLVRTPFFHRKLQDYFDNYIQPNPDTSIFLADKLINRMEQAGSREQFKYTIHFLLGYYQKSKYMCFDKALYHMTKNYYCSGRAFWADSAFQQEMCEQSGKMAPTLCELPAPELDMPDTTFTLPTNSLYAQESPVTILIFWDINCGHCKKEMPIIKEYYDSCDKEEVFIYAVYTQGDWEGWKKYVRENELNFMNVGNAFGTDEFRKHYNITTTPQIYVLDKDKKIKYKKIGAADIPNVVESVLKEQQVN